MKGGFEMSFFMDLMMIGTLAICYLLVKYFADWCGHQVEKF
jgi:hypothetical protein